MPRMPTDVLADFLQQPHTGVIASLRRDGRPYTVPIWWLYDGDSVPQSHHDPMPGSFWLTGTTTRVWCKQLMNDRCCPGAHPRSIRRSGHSLWSRESGAPVHTGA